MKNYNPLTEEEARIILHKGTEAPNSGEYNDMKDQGVFLCRSAILRSSYRK